MGSDVEHYGEPGAAASEDAQRPTEQREGLYRLVSRADVEHEIRRHFGWTRDGRELTEILEALQADAARYRWLRDYPWCVTDDPIFPIITQHKNALWDKAIDNAIDNWPDYGG